MEAYLPPLLLFGISVLSTVLGLVLFLKTPIMGVMGRFMRTIGTSVNALNNYQLTDDEELKLSRKLSMQILGGLLLLLVLLVGVVALAAAPFLLVDFDQYTLWELVGYIAGGVVLASVVYFIWFHQPAPQEYSDGKQLFFYLTLGAPGLGKLNHNLNRMLYGKRPVPQRGIVVTGLARAGTTTLLQYLSQHPDLQSLTYRHMPFLLGGRVWRGLNTGKDQARERSHKDGIMVSLDSPEAFDEYYWRVILKEGYYKKVGLVRHKIEPTQAAQFEEFLSQQLQPGKLYLSKNNNFVLRMHSFLEHRPDYTVALVFREPLTHAQSLLRQQKNQTQQQDEEPFILDYMNWLGHNEFGKGRMDFRLTGEKMHYKDALTLNYWLERWLEYYSYVIGLQLPQVVFVSNRQIATQPLVTVNRVLETQRLQLAHADFPTREPKPASGPPAEVDAAIWEKAQALYKKLLERAQV